MNQNESGVDPPHSWIEQDVVHSMDSPTRRSLRRRRTSHPCPYRSLLPLEKARIRVLGVNQAKSTQIGPGHGGSPLLITPENPRAPEVG